MHCVRSSHKRVRFNRSQELQTYKQLLLLSTCSECITIAVPVYCGHTIAVSQICKRNGSPRCGIGRCAARAPRALRRLDAEVSAAAATRPTNGASVLVCSARRRLKGQPNTPLRLERVCVNTRILSATAERCQLMKQRRKKLRKKRNLSMEMPAEFVCVCV